MVEVCDGDQGVEWRTELNGTWLKSMEDRLQNHCLPGQRKRSSAQQPATIFKVLSNIREANTEAFEPQLISFGPYHHGKLRLKAMEEHKWRYLRKFLARNPNKCLRDYVVKIKLVIDRARRCYWDEVLMEGDPFVEMLILDGSMIVELLLMRQESKPPPEDEDFDPIVDTMWTLPLIVYDMLKLENQVPFFVLEGLYDVVMDVGIQAEEDSGSCSTDDQPSYFSLKELVFNFVSRNLFEDHIVVTKPPPEDDIHHMLHFFHSCIIQNQPIKSSRKHRRRFWYRYRRSTLRGLSSLRYMLLRAVSRESTTSRRVQGHSDEESGNTTDDAESIPTAQELKEAGIDFKRKKRGGFLEVTFSGGVMEMTPVVIDEESSTVFHNLIAFEQCYPDAGAHVTGYSVFLDCLIDTPADVGVLRRKGVVENKLGSDKEAAILVNRLCQQVAVGDHPLSGLFTKVEHYCRSSWPRWRAKLSREYFGNPWAIISLVAAVVLLFLTGVQTAFTVLAYINPPNNGSPSNNR